MNTHPMNPIAATLPRANPSTQVPGPRRLYTATLGLLAAAALAACGAMPANTALDQARTDYRNAQANGQTQTLAAVEMKQAADALAQADAAFGRHDDAERVTQLAYLARQRVALAQETAGRKASEASVAEAGAERDRLRLAARTREADAATQDAAASKRDAASAQQQSQAAQRQSADAQQQAAASGRQAAASQQQASAAQQQATTAQQQASAAQQDAAQSRQQAAAAQQQAASSQQQASMAQQQAGDAEQRNQALSAQLAELQAKKTDLGMVVTIGDVLFDTGLSDLKSGGQRHIERLGTFLKAYPQRKAMIEGYTDSTGSDSANMALSGRRADAVMTALLDQGVGRGQLAAQGYGEAHPVAGNGSAGGRQMNRRVEVLLSDDSGVLTPR